MSSGTNHGDEIAIIGMAGRFPAANTLEEFWYNIQNGLEAVVTLSDEELLAAGVDPADLSNSQYVKAAVPLDNIDVFDALFFGISPREAEIIDPQQRLFLECAWQAIEHAGYDPLRYPGPIGVYGGVSSSDYLLANIATHPGLIQKLGPLQVALGNDKDYLATRVSYKLNLSGPSITVQTACSSSLVAVHIACQSLLSGECTMALAGGASLLLPQRVGYIYREGDVLSPDGHCRSFDAQAQGAIKGSGVGIVVLKLLDQALQDNDTIHAVIKGSAVNNDGAHKVGFTAPSVDRQAQVIAESLKVAGVEAETVTYIETHGSGTPLGDPIEVAALTQAYRQSTTAQQFCALGSVKTNIGHLSAASGIAGLIKTVLALQHKQFPPILNYKEPNPQIDFVHSPFYVNYELHPWSVPGNHPRRAGVSSFGLGGTNAHLILEEAPAAVPSGPSRPWQLIILSAATAKALEMLTTNLLEYMQQPPEQKLADIAYTYQIGRKQLLYRRAIVCQDQKSMLQACETEDTQRVFTAMQPSLAAPSVTFLFPGVGNQYVNMARELYACETIFRETIDYCCLRLTDALHVDLREILYPAGNPTPTGKVGMNLLAMLQRQESVNDEGDQRIYMSCYSHPLLFIVEYALAQLWQSWGVQPQAMIGYSIGEYVAACLAGVFSLEDALHLVTTRALMIHELPPSAMCAVSLSEDELQPLLQEDTYLASINSSSLCIVSGTLDAVAHLEQHLEQQQVVYRRLQTTHALHSPLIAPITQSFRSFMQTIPLHPPRIPYISSITGTWITDQEATDPGYWTEHLSHTLHFGNGMQTLLQDTTRILLEVGPGRSLCSLAHQSSTKAEIIAIPTVCPAYEQQSDEMFLLQTLARLWVTGVPIDWSTFNRQEQRRHLALPTYPFQRERYWIAPPGDRSVMDEGQSHSIPTNGEQSGSSAEINLLPVNTYPLQQRFHKFIAPRNDIEARLAETWEELLGVSPISVNDNFFELGGNSLATSHLVFRLREMFQLNIPLDYPFKVPVLEDLAMLVEEMLIEKLETLSEEEAQQIAAHLS